MCSPEPPERDNVLPDLHRLMDSLEDGHSDLESQNDPPSLFTRPEHVPKYKKITELKMEIEVFMDSGIHIHFCTLHPFICHFGFKIASLLTLTLSYIHKSCFH